MSTVRKGTFTTLAVVAAIVCLLVAYLMLHQGPTASQDQDSRQEADTADDAREVVAGTGEGEPAVDEQAELPSPDLSVTEIDTEDLQLEGELDLTIEENQRRLRMARYEALEVQLVAE